MSVVWTGDEAHDEQARRKCNRERALEALQAAGANGISNIDLMAIAGSRAGGRVGELRDAGYTIDCEPIDRTRGLYRYTFRSAPASARLSALPVRAYLDHTGHVRALDAEAAAAPVGKLF